MTNLSAAFMTQSSLFRVLFVLAIVVAAAVFPIPIMVATAATAASSSTLGTETPLRNPPSHQGRGKGKGVRGDVILRLHLVRHGETESNYANVVLGQRESPLTERGLAQARALGTSPAFGGGGRVSKRYWRAYSSDFDRTRVTAGLVLGGREATDIGAGQRRENGEVKAEVEAKDGALAGVNVRRPASTTEARSDASVITASSTATAADSDIAVVDNHTCESPDLFVIPDKRLRERAKGVREGYPKALSYDEALQRYRAERGDDAPLPLLETDDDVWDRVRGWIDDLVAEMHAEAAAEDEEQEKEKEEEGAAERSEGGEGSSNGRKGIYRSLLGKMERDERDLSGIDPSARRRRYDVLAVSHSATIRTAVGRLVPDELPPDVARGPVGKDGLVENMLTVPNTSVTVIDVVSSEAEGGRTNGDDGGRDERIPWSARLVELTNTDHLAGMR